MPTYEDELAQFDEFLNIPAVGLPPTEDNQKLAAMFALKKWRERAKEISYRRKDGRLPVNLSGACKFCSMFAVKLFGGRMRGNEGHQWVVLSGLVIDLTGNVCDAVYEHDGDFWLNEDHVGDLVSCLPRVLKWVEEFCTLLRAEIKTGEKT